MVNFDYLKEGIAITEQVTYKCVCGETWDGFAWLEHGVHSANGDDSDLCPECGEIGDIV
jgi:hypothetical protein